MEAVCKKNAIWLNSNFMFSKNAAVPNVPQVLKSQLCKLKIYVRKLSLPSPSKSQVISIFISSVSKWLTKHFSVHIYLKF